MICTMKIRKDKGMKRFFSVICILLIALIIAVIVAGCTEVVSEKPIDTKYTAAYDAMETVYSYKYDWWHGDFKYLPELKMVHHDEKYEVQYEIVYANGSTQNEWRTVSKAEYEAALIDIEGASNAE